MTNHQQLDSAAHEAWLRVRELENQIDGATDPAEHARLAAELAEPIAKARANYETARKASEERA